MGAVFTASGIFKAIDKVTRPMRLMAKSVQSFAKKTDIALARVERAGRRVIKTFSKMLGNLGKLGLGFGAFQLITGATSAITDYESALVGVGKTTGEEGTALKQLGSEIIKTSDLLRTVKSSKLLELAEAAGQLGVKGSANIVKFSTTMAKLEKSSDVVGEEGAKSIARLLTITKEGVGVVDQFSASLVALGNSSAASESEILSVASEVGRATAAYSLNSKEILGIAASLKSLDVAPEAAGSAIGKVFRGIELATLKGGKNLQNFAKIMQLTPKQVTKTFKDTPQKAFSLFVKGLGRIKDEGGSVAKSLIDVGLSGERVSKGIIPLATNYQLLEDKLILSKKAFKENIALDKEFAASQKTIKSAINSVVRAYENLFIKQATAGSGLEKIQKVLFAVADNMGTVVTVAALLIGSFLAFKAAVLITNTVLLASNIIMGISAAISGASAFAVHGNTVAYAAFRGAVLIATAAQWLFNVAMTANPIGLIIVGIAALIAIIVLLVVKWKDIVNWVKTSDSGFAKFIRTAFGGIMKVGKVIVLMLIQPLRIVLLLLNKISGGKFGGGALAKVNQFQANLVADINDVPREELSTTKTTAAQESISREERISTQRSTLDINDNTSNKFSVESTGSFPIQLGSTNGLD